ncbi:hypothetical protein [Streptomyces violaceusniger]|uniref:hypothetical protein n=1 Tax=Streptomyces violaceusniger TaxID=68280 RepID=UPI0026C69CAD
MNTSRLLRANSAFVAFISATRSFSVFSPPAAGKTTERTEPSGAPSEAAAIFPSSPDLPRTLVNSATNASVTFFSTRA